MPPADEPDADEEPGPFYEERGEMVEVQITLPEIKSVNREAVTGIVAALAVFVSGAGSVRAGGNGARDCGAVRRWP